MTIKKRNKRILGSSSVLVTLLVLFAFALGCSQGQDSIDDLIDESVVIVRCENIITNGFIVHQVIEILRDESQGSFEKNIGEIIDRGMPVDGDDCGRESLLFYGMLNNNIYNHRALFIHSGIVPYAHKKSILDVKKMIENSKFSGKDLIIPTRPQGE